MKGGDPTTQKKVIKQSFNAEVGSANPKCHTSHSTGMCWEATLETFVGQLARKNICSIMLAFRVKFDLSKYFGLFYSGTFPAMFQWRLK